MLSVLNKLNHVFSIAEIINSGIRDMITRHKDVHKEEKPNHENSLCFSVITCHFLAKCLNILGVFGILFCLV